MTNYYVSKSGSNTTGTSWASAWNELNQITWSVMSPGDTLYLDGGASGMTYTTTMTIGKSGTSGAPITISRSTESGHDGIVTLFGGRTHLLPYGGQTSYTYVAPTLSKGIVFGAHSYVTLDGLSWHGIYIYGCGLYGIDMSVSPTHCTVRNVEINDIGTASQFTGPNGFGWYPDVASHCIYLNGDHLTFFQCDLHDQADDCFDGGEPGRPATNITIDHCWLHTSRENPNYPGEPFNEITHQDGYQIYDGGLHQGPITFTDCVIGPGLGNGLILGQTGTGGVDRATVDNLTLSNCLLIGKGVNVMTYPGLTTPEANWVIDHCTSVSLTGTEPWPEAGGGTSFVVQCIGTNHKITNSIFYKGFVNCSTLAAASGNCHSGTNGTATPLDGINADPKFTTDISGYTYATSLLAYTNADYTLQPTSPCLGAGPRYASIARFLAAVSTTPPSATVLLQSATGSVGSANANNVTVTTDPTGAGSLLVAYVMVQGASVTITPPAGWTQVGTTQGVSGGTGSVAMFYQQNSTSGVTSHLFSFNASCNAAVAFEEWSGVATSNALDQQVAKQNAKGASALTGTTTALAGSGELAIWGLAVPAASMLTYSSITNGYTEDTSANAASSQTTRAEATLFYKTNVAAAPTSSGATMSGTGVAGNTTILAVFRVAGTGTALSGTLAGVGTLTGTLSLTGGTGMYLSGECDGVGTLTGTLSVPATIRGTYTVVIGGILI